MSKHIVALFGNVALERGHCKACKVSAFIRDGLYTCCDAPATGRAGTIVRKSEAPTGRKLPSLKERARILAEQDNKCLYCGVTIGSIRIRGTKLVTLRLNWDHSLPYIYSYNNSSSNFVAACHVCNGIKSDKIYDNLEDAKEKLAKIRAGKGYDF